MPKHGLVMPWFLSVNRLKVPIFGLAMDDFDDHEGANFELGPPDWEDEHEMWNKILPTSDDHQYHAELFMEDPAGMMQPDEDGPPEMHLQNDDGASLENLPTVQEDGDEVVAAMWDPYTVEGSLEEPTLVTTPSPKAKRTFDSVEATETPGFSSSSPPPLKRRRLQGKQSPSSPKQRLPFKDYMSQKTFEELSHLARQKTGVEKVRDFWGRVRRPIARREKPGLNNKELNAMVRKEWHDMSKDDKKAVAA